MHVIKTRLRNKLAEGRIEEVITELRKISINDLHIHNEILQISAQYVENERRIRLNIVNQEAGLIERNRIHNSILSVIDHLPDHKDIYPLKNRRSRIFLWLGTIATVVTITVYSVKELINKISDRDKTTIVRDSIDLPTVLPEVKPIKPNPELKGHPHETPTIVDNPPVKYVDDTQDVQVAFLDGGHDDFPAVIEKIKSDLTKNKISFSDTYLLTNFRKKYNGGIKKIEPAELRAIGIPENLNCICQILCDVDYQSGEEEGMAVYSSTGKVDVFVLSLRTGQLDHIQIIGKGAGVSEPASLKILEQNLLKSERLSQIHLSQCK